MSASAAPDLAFPKVVIPSRLVPGLAVPMHAVPRKKADSSVQEGPFWTARALHASPRPSLWVRLAEAVLPAPASRNQRLALAAQVLLDFGVLFANFAGFGLLEMDWHLNVGASPRPSHTSWLFSGPELGVALLFGAVFTLMGYSERLYHPETGRAPRDERAVVGKVVFLSTILVGTILAWFGAGRIAFLTPLITAPANFLALLGWREGRRHMGLAWSHRRPDVRNTLIVGAGLIGNKLADRLEQDHLRKHVVKGFLDETAPLGGRVRGRLEDLPQVARSEFVDEIILTIPPHSPAARGIIRDARRNRIDVKVVPDLFGFDPLATTLERFGDVPVLTLCEERIPAWGLLWKRGIDVVLSALGLVATFPLLAAIALAVKVDSRGPVLYRAQRLGWKGRRFLCCKFRTMMTNADQLKERLRLLNERQGPFFKLGSDPRITRVGAILRRYSLDELPQLWNVLLGEMSLVGPRPHPVDDFERYRLEDWQRLEVLPGMTGLWQVTARSDPSFERSMSLDREYIASWSLRADLEILLRTVAVVLRGEGV